MSARFAKRVEWELTRACALSCRHCHQRSRTARPRELDTEEALAVAAELGRRGCEVVTLSGGEPTARADWPQVALALGRAGVAVQLVTNGQHLGPIEARLARAARVGAVHLSVDGVGPLHDWVRRREGCFARLERAVEALHDADIPVGFTTTLLSANVEALEALAAWVARQAPVSWQVWLGRPRDRSRLWLRPAHLSDVAARLHALQRRLPVLTAGDNLGLGAAHAGLRRPDELTDPCAAAEGSPQVWRCGAGTEVLGLRADGTVTGCLALPEGTSVGSVRHVPLPHLWRLAGEARRQRVEHLSGRCGSCELAEACQGGCHAMALATTGALDNPYCLAAPPVEVSTARSHRAGAAASVVLAAALGATCGPRAELTHAPSAPVGQVEPAAPRPAAREAPRPQPKPDAAAPAKRAHPPGTARLQPGTPCMYTHMGCWHLRQYRKTRKVTKRKGSRKP